MTEIVTSSSMRRQGKPVHGISSEAPDNRKSRATDRIFLPTRRLCLTLHIHPLALSRTHSQILGSLFDRLAPTDCHFYSPRRLASKREKRVYFIGNGLHHSAYTFTNPSKLWQARRFEAEVSKAEILFPTG